MEAQMIYPTAPPGAHAEGVEHVESSGKPEGMMSKVKRKARNLRDRYKVAAGTDSTDNDHEDIKHEDELRQHAIGSGDEEVDKEAKLCEDDEEEHDHVKSADNQFKHEPLRSIGKLDNQEGGPEVEVHGATPDTCSKSADDDVPISPYKDEGSSDALQAAPTKHHNYDESILQLGGDVKSLSFEQSPHGETAEPENNWSTRKHNEVKDEGSFLTSPLGIVDDATYEPNAVAQHYGTGESLDNKNSAFAKVTDYPISDTADGVEYLHGETVEPEKNQQESWCKSSADKLNNAKDVVTTGLPGADNTSESETQQSGFDGWNNNALNGDVAMRVDGSDRAPNSKDDVYVDALSKPRFSEDVRKDADEENFYDPNDDKDSQFQDGFAHGSGNADEDALNSSQPSSAIGKFEGLKDTVASTLGYGDESSHHTEGGEDEEENPYSKREDVNFPPTHQQTGFFQEPKDTVAGYGKQPIDEFSHGDDGEQSRVAEEECKPEADIDGSRPQTGGALQGLKNVVASELGYGTAGKLPSPPSESMHTDSTPVETIADAQPQYDDGGEDGGVGKAGNASSIAGDDAEKGESHSPKPTGFFQGMKNMVASTLGYTGSEGAHAAETHDKVPVSSN